MPWEKEGRGLVHKGSWPFDMDDLTAKIDRLDTSLEKRSKPVCAALREVLSTQKVSKQFVMRQLSCWCDCAYDEPTKIATEIAGILFNGHVCQRLYEQHGKNPPKVSDADDLYEQWRNDVVSNTFPENGEKGASIMNLSELEKIVQLLKNNGNLVLTGAPGTGKTYLANQIAVKMLFGGKYDTKGLDPKDLEKTDRSLFDDCVEFVQFHPSYDYADFVEGIKPSDISSKSMKFEVKPGIFKIHCEKAAANPNHYFIFIIDEINRADLSRVFGELFFGLESDYRGQDHAIKTQYSYLQGGKKLVIPGNLYIIGTMNDIDRSVESMDFALRRRFVWKEITAEMSEGIIDRADMNDSLKAEAKKCMKHLNEKIKDTFGSRAYQIGGAYFKKIALYKAEPKPFDTLWENHLENVLREYLRGNKNLEGKMKELKEAYDNGPEEHAGK